MSVRVCPTQGLAWAHALNTGRYSSEVGVQLSAPPYTGQPLRQPWQHSILNLRYCDRGANQDTEASQGDPGPRTSWGRPGNDGDLRPHPPAGEGRGGCGDVFSHNRSCKSSYGAIGGTPPRARAPVLHACSSSLHTCALGQCVLETHHPRGGDPSAVPSSRLQPGPAPAFLGI